MTRSIDDVHSFEKEISKARDRLQKAVMIYEGKENQEKMIRPITPENKQLIEKFLLKLRREELSTGTILSHLNYITWLTQTLYEIGFERSILDMDQDTFDLFLLNLDSRGIKPGTIRTYKRTLKKFFRVMADNNVPKWVQQLKLKSIESPVQPSDLLTKEELDKMLEACNTPRDRALIAVLADGGMRIGALASCRIKNVDFGQYGSMIYLSKTSKSNKTTPAKGIPLTWSTGYLSQWLANHPFKEDPEAPLWTTENKNHDPISYASIRSILLHTGERAGIKKKLNPHMFRHLAITSWIFDGLSEQEIKHRAGWSKGSTRMFNVYANFTDQEINDSIYEKYGLKTEDKRQVTLKKCPRCGNVLRQEDRFCSQCSLVLNHKACDDMQKYEKVTPKIIEILASSESGRQLMAHLNES